MENRTNDFQLVKATLQDIPLIRQLSQVIWYEHYPEIISRQQIDYMLGKMYSNEKLSSELALPDFYYYLAMRQSKCVGYLGISRIGASSYMLNKFYLLRSEQSKGLGKQLFDAVFQPFDPSEIRLFVNRQNYRSVNFYFKLGFRITEVVDNHFGDGYYMNDYVMLWRKKEV